MSFSKACFLISRLGLFGVPGEGESGDLGEVVVAISSFTSAKTIINKCVF